MSDRLATKIKMIHYPHLECGIQLSYCNYLFRWYNEIYENYLNRQLVTDLSGRFHSLDETGYNNNPRQKETKGQLPDRGSDMFRFDTWGFLDNGFPVIQNIYYIFIKLQMLGIIQYLLKDSRNQTSVWLLCN